MRYRAARGCSADGQKVIRRLANLEAFNVTEAIREHGIRSRDQPLQPAPRRKFANQQVGLTLAAAVVPGEIDVADFHVATVAGSWEQAALNLKFIETFRTARSYRSRLQRDLGVLALKSRHDCRATAVAPDVNAGPRHIQDAVEHQENTDRFNRQIHGGQNNCYSNE